MLTIRPFQPGDVVMLKGLIHSLAKFERLPVVVTEEDLLRDGFRHHPPNSGR